MGLSGVVLTYCLLQIQYVAKFLRKKWQAFIEKQWNSNFLVISTKIFTTFHKSLWLFKGNNG